MPMLLSEFIPPSPLVSTNPFSLHLSLHPFPADRVIQIFFYFLDFFQWFIVCLVAYSLASTYSCVCVCVCFVVFFFFLVLDVVSYSGGWKRCLIWFQSFKIYCDLFCGLACDISQRMLHVHMKGMCICAFCYFWMERPVDTYQIHLCYLRPHCLIDFLSEWSVHNVNRMLKSSTIILLLSISPFMSVNITDKQKLREFCTTKPALQQILKDIL